MLYEKVETRKEGDNTTFPCSGQEVQIRYYLYLNGEEIQSSNQFEALSFVIDHPHLAPWMNQCIKQLSVGEISTFHVPTECCDIYAEKMSPSDKITIEINLISIPTAKELAEKPKQAQSIVESIEAAMECKTSGNYFFALSNYTQAIDYYKQGLSYVEKISEWSESQIVTATAVKISLLNNLSLMYLKQEEYYPVIYTTNDLLRLLESEKKNNKNDDYIKALYRNGIANMKVGNLDAAHKSLSQGQHLDPGNSAINASLQECQKLLQTSLSKEKTLFGKGKLFVTQY